jgi:beta-galactosidase beta subunit
MNEKYLFLNEAADKQFILFLEHDAHNELCTVKKTDKGVRLQNSYAFHEVFS